MHKNTLYITFDGLSDPLGQSQILPYLCGLARKGYPIHILSCEKKDRLAIEKNNIEERIQGIEIDWQYILYDEEGGFLSRMHYIRQLRSMAEKTMKEKHPALVHCRSYLASLIGLSLKIKYHIPFLFDMRGFWADERLDGGIWKKRNPLHRLFYAYFKAKEKQFLQKADAIISLTVAAKTELLKQHPSANIASKTTIIPCCTNTELFKPGSAQTDLILPELSNKDHVLIYTGSIGTWYYTRELIDCVLVWKTKIPNLKLLILTKDRTALHTILNSYTVEQQKIIVVASASYKTVSSYLALAHAAIFFIKPAYSKMASSPTKMAECWAMDLPIITNAGIGDNDLYFKDQEGGILIQEFSPKAYLKSCEEYLKLIKKPGAYRELALRHFDNNIAIERYSEVYSRCLNSIS